MDLGRHQRRWHRLKGIMRVITTAEHCQEGCIELGYPRKPWYVENAAAMLRVLCDTGARLEQALGLPMPPTSCYVVEPETALQIQDAVGVAYQSMIIVGVPERQLSVLGGVGAHELAHILSHQLGEAAPPFKSEGFACYAAWLIRAHQMPMGIPLHYHLGWLLSVGVRPTLDSLWERWDYTPELYDLAWSFAAFLAGRFGLERYLAFYRSARLCLRDRLDEALGMTLEALQREWHDHARRCLGDNPARVARMHRWPGTICSRAAWLHG